MADDKAAQKRQRQEQAKARRKQQKRQASRSFREQQELDAVEAAIADGMPAAGSNPLAFQEYQPGQYASARKFEDLPLSQATKTALKQAKYTSMTAVQRATIPHALCGRDVLGAAKTGSGKTLAFLVPLVELLYRRRWTRLDGLGALVLTPTRELAIQIFETLVKVGKNHDLSAGLLIGGKDVQQERLRVNAMNIIIATPGRLLQHMDETPGFDASTLQMLVLDEADRILDMGFAPTLDAILDNLPREGRQTLLFSATQTKSVKDLARLSLSNPEYIAVHAEAAVPTPLKLQQAYMVVPLQDKMDVLWSFIKTHLRCRIIVFLSTCKQVRFVHEAFRKLRPGVPLRCLHGGMKQGKRLGVFQEFSAAQAGEGLVLLATDIAARGLDFPTVDWVVQLDCPEDVTAYIHRVGRCARYMSAGRALLLLTPSERAGMLAQLEEAKVPIKQLRHNPAAVQPVGPALQALLSKSTELKDFAQRGLVAYVRSVFLQPNKAVFDVSALPADEFAASLGLLGAPKLRFLKRSGKKVVEEVVVGGGGGVDGLQAAAGDGAAEQPAGKAQGNHHQQQVSDADTSADDSSQLSEGDEEDSDQEHQQQPATAGAKRSREQPAAPGSSKRSKAGTGGAAPAGLAAAAAEGDDSEEEDDLLVVKQRDVFDVAPESAEADPAAADAAAAGGSKKRKKQRIKLGLVSSNRTVFDEEGEAVDPLQLLAASDTFNSRGGEGSSGEGAAAPGLHVVAEGAAQRFQATKELMRVRDAADKAAAAALRRQMRLERKARLRALAQGESAPVATLGGGSESEGEGGFSEELESEPGLFGSDSSSSEQGSDSGGEPERVDAACAGMARRSQLPPTGQQQQRAKGKAAAARQGDAEALALQLLQQRHGR